MHHHAVFEDSGQMYGRVIDDLINIFSHYQGVPNTKVS